MKTNITLKGMALATGLTLALSAAGVANANLTMPYGNGTTIYSVMNVGSTPATVVATYYNPDGTTQLASTHNLPVNGRLDVTVGQSPDGPLPGNWSGSVVLSSDQDIVAVARIKYAGRPNANENNPGQTPGTESSAYEAFNSGSTSLYFPIIVRVKRAAQPTVAQLATRFTVQNTSASPATVYLNFRNFNGNTYPPQIITLNGYGSRTWDTAVTSDLTPPVPASDLAPNVVQFSLFVTGTQPLVGVAEQSWNFDGLIGATSVKQNWAADYAAIPASEATTTLYGPLVAGWGGQWRTASVHLGCVHQLLLLHAVFSAEHHRHHGDGDRPVHSQQHRHGRQRPLWRGHRLGQRADPALWHVERQHVQRRQPGLRPEQQRLLEYLCEWLQPQHRRGDALQLERLGGLLLHPADRRLWLHPTTTKHPELRQRLQLLRRERGHQHSAVAARRPRVHSQ